MKKEIVINKEILEKIYSIDENDNIKNFLIDALVWEYDNIDEKKPRVTKKFDDLVSKYIGK
ncbi:hypothetical protein [uncultured Methanobrevibacter sp.]|uniref:hypothetical protein n=1 Tax=uncultured Methanobrevibacter sp. TaxID=253161 RepID=UPI002623512A|nr:hypothetical protein [uncultured Methanobrevibacter sp.]